MTMLYRICKFTRFGRILSFSLGTALLLSSCSGLKTTPTKMPEEEHVSIFTGKAGGIKLSDFGTKETSSGDSLPVNALLWRAALDIASFVPLDDVDTFGGSIVTEWHQPKDTLNQRLKLTMFVIGHELGHHSLQHYLTHVQQESLERQMQQRAQEISVDRLGLVACQNLNTAASAMIKTLSGLNEAHLGSDIRGFLDQAKALRKPISGENARNSHPSLLMRCRALLWFSNVYTETDIASKNFSEHMLKVNQRVKDDFEKFVEAPSINFLKGVARNLGMWIAANKIILKGVFSKSDQAAFSSLYGKDNLHKFKRLLESSSKKEVVVFIEKKVEENNRHLKSLVPSSFEGHRRSIINEIDKAF